MTECEPESADAMTAREAPFLEAHTISAGYSQVPIIQEVSLQVGLGEVVLVIGPNGAGKSTLVKALTGTVPLLGGRIALAGKDVSRTREDERMALGVGYVPQVRDVFPPLTVVENLEMGAYRMSSAATASRMTEIFDLFPTLVPLRRRAAKTLSGGERKLVGIARAIMANPQLLILDEPTAGLSPLIAATVLEETVSKLAGTGRAVLLIEQRVSLGLKVASWGYVLTDGRLRMEKSAAELRAMENLSEIFLNARVSTTERIPDHGAGSERRVGAARAINSTSVSPREGA